jgi:four helix bundle protein
MIQNFRTYKLAIEFYQTAEKQKINKALKDQLIRASSSIALNLAEGSAKPTSRDRKKFYHIALGSLRECQTILELTGANQELKQLSDSLGAHLYKLCKST